MRVKPEFDPEVDDLAPVHPDITIYDEIHFITYLRLLDAEVDRADWTGGGAHRSSSRSGRRRGAHANMLGKPSRPCARMTKVGYRKILEQAAADARTVRH
jgi:hypothetical protein